ncbi:MAG: hypothetical protein VR70_05315 [Rhodospirillaceae bacterium BRH_c57]|nr:MAG: hypothetical protein VR70_05315 [Rhodospirillaceae bacterium BRH_c57]
MTPEQVAKRYAFDRPGYKLIDFLEVAVPVYRLSLLASFLERKSIAPLYEFALRSLELGLNTEEEIGSFLGIGSETARAALSNLHGLELIDVTLKNGTRDIKITNMGHRCLKETAAIVPRVGPIIMHFDGLTREIFSTKSESLMYYRQVNAAGIREIAAKPPRKPALDELSIEEARKASRTLSEVRNMEKRDLLSIKGIEESTRMFQVAVVLVYRSEDGETDLSMFVDGRLSDKHKMAFLKADGLRKLGLNDPARLVPEALPFEATLTPQQKEELLFETEQAAAVYQQAQFDIEEGEGSVSGDEGSASGEASQNIDIDSIISAAMQSISKHRIRWLEVFEHPSLLEDALDNARKRLLIISPWIRGQVLTHQKLNKIKRLLDNNVDVFIGWGIGKGEPQERGNDMNVVNRLVSLDKEYHNMHFVDLENTHEKVLIKDNDFVVTTSFNWLSFRGDPARTVRYERGVYVGVREMVDDQFAALSARFISSKGVRPSDAQMAALSEKFGGT